MADLSSWKAIFTEASISSKEAIFSLTYKIARWIVLEENEGLLVLCLPRARDRGKVFECGCHGCIKVGKMFLVMARVEGSGSVAKEMRQRARGGTAWILGISL